MTPPEIARARDRDDTMQDRADLVLDASANGRSAMSSTHRPTTSPMPSNPTWTTSPRRSSDGWNRFWFYADRSGDAGADSPADRHDAGLHALGLGLSTRRVLRDELLDVGRRRTAVSAERVRLFVLVACPAASGDDVHDSPAWSCWCCLRWDCSHGSPPLRLWRSSSRMPTACRPRCSVWIRSTAC